MKQIKTTIDYLRILAEEKHGELKYDTSYDLETFNIKIDTPDGISAVTDFVKKKTTAVIIEYSNGVKSRIAKNHIIVTIDGCRKTTDLSIGDIVLTNADSVHIVNISDTDLVEDFYDITVDNISHTYYDGNGITHHNTFTVEKVLHAAGKTDGNGYFKVSGSASPIGIYKALFQHKDGIVLFDDCDSALDDQTARNIIKAATDTKKERKINWMKKGGKEFYDPESEDAPDEDSDSEDDRTPYHFVFTGKVIFISNLPMAKLDPDGALRTRSFIVNIDPTDLELVDYMAKLAPSIQLEDGLTLSKEQRQEVTDLIKSMVGKRQGLSLRNLVRGLNIRASGISDWKTIITRYA